MAEQPDFIQKQYEFAAHIRNPDENAKPGDVESRRMKIYSELFYNNVEGFIANTYPVLHEIMDEDSWHAMIRDYFSSHLSHTPLFPEMPREFLKYLEDERDTSNDFPFISELAHYEWVELALMTSDLDQEINWDKIDPESDLLSGQPVLSPLAWPLQYTYAVQNIGPDYLPEKPLDEPVYLIIYRDMQDEVHFMELNPVTALLIQLISEQNNLTGKEILVKIAEQLNHPQPEVVIDGGASILNDLKQRNILLGVNKS